jgi:hypothetical protein
VSKHQFAFDGWHGGRHDARGGMNNVMMFDGKLSAVYHAGRWLVYARANLKEHGGRYVVVARSRTSAAWGDPAYEDFRMIDVDGYDRNGFAAMLPPSAAPHHILPHRTTFCRTAPHSVVSHRKGYTRV